MEDRGPLICVHSWELLGIRSWEVKDHLKKEPSLLHSVGDSSREKKKITVAFAIQFQPGAWQSE